MSKGETLIWQASSTETKIEKLLERIEALENRQREWVGLTDEEVQTIWKDATGWGDPSHDDEDLVRAIEAKLKEKNT